MRYGKEHKAETRKRILAAAARLFRERGYDGVGVDAIMGEVGLTAGGFYAHFASKEALFAEAMGRALTEGRALGAPKSEPRASAGLRAGSPGEGDPLLSLIRGYLSRTHRDHPDEGCPLPVLSTDVARSGDATRKSYEKQFLKYLAEVEAILPEGDAPVQDRALALIAQCVGGLMLARAVKDEELSNQILKACRNAATKIAEK
ncbi:MAG TPA: TetR/AcrR family transcriptional regulator [Blastocatellia bacterium]|nr:TetR/AcrR family transcriptional regulator [Blastocatellia bacterium]